MESTAILAKERTSTGDRPGPVYGGAEDKICCFRTINIFKALSAILCVCLLGCVFYIYSLQKKQDNVNASSYTAGHMASINDDASGFDFRLNTDTSRCSEPFCKQCSTLVYPKQIKHFVSCAGTIYSKVKNGSCYLCKNENCKTFQVMMNSGCSRWPHATCCELAKMGNLGNSCSNGMTFNCQTASQRMPVCSCPAGKTGPGCADVKIPIMCKCFKTSKRFCNDNMPLCSNVKFDLEHSFCQIKTTDEHCICNNTHSREAGIELGASCDVPRAELLTHDALSSSASKALVPTSLAITVWNFVLRENT